MNVTMEEGDDDDEEDGEPGDGEEREGEIACDSSYGRATYISINLGLIPQHEDVLQVIEEGEKQRKEKEEETG